MASGLPKKISVTEAKGKIEHYCAYQERCHQEVRNKLFEFGLRSGEVDEIISDLVTSNFLNEERYAKAFAGGKFRMKKWGKIKIKHAMEAHGLSSYCVKAGLKEIDDQDYLKTLHQLIEKKKEEVDDENIFASRDKISKYVIQKGFEPELVWKALKELMP